MKSCNYLSVHAIVIGPHGAERSAANIIAIVTDKDDAEVVCGALTCHKYMSIGGTPAKPRIVPMLLSLDALATAMPISQ